MDDQTSSLPIMISQRCAWCQQFNLEEIFDWPNYFKGKHVKSEAECSWDECTYPDLEYPEFYETSGYTV
jgi:hypothetical protein